MASCANCIHHSLCDYNTNISGNGKIRLVYAEGADVKCSFFQNTADVVQKSEVERWRRNLEAVLEERAETKSEVAREIFEEIYDRLMTSFPTSSFIDAPCTTENRLYSMLAELKKKYTGGKNEL